MTESNNPAQDPTEASSAQDEQELSLDEMQGVAGGARRYTPADYAPKKKTTDSSIRSTP